MDTIQHNRDIRLINIYLAVRRMPEAQRNERLAQIPDGYWSPEIILDSFKDRDLKMNNIDLAN